MYFSALYQFWTHFLLCVFLDIFLIRNMDF